MRPGLFAILGTVVLAVFLAGCTIENDTRINPDGSVRNIFAFGITTEEIQYMQKQSTTPADLSTFCTGMLTNSQPSMPVGTTSNQADIGDELWCTFDMPFATLQDLSKFITAMGLSVNRLELTSSGCYYDISLPMADFGSTQFPISILWHLTMPGAIQSGNANFVDGSQAEWYLSSTQPGAVELHAESAPPASTPTPVPSPTPAPASTVNQGLSLWTVGGLSCLILGLLVVVVILGGMLWRTGRKEEPTSGV